MPKRPRCGWIIRVINAVYTVYDVTFPCLEMLTFADSTECLTFPFPGTIFVICPNGSITRQVILQGVMP